MTQKILVTGGLGFIGSAFARRAVDRDAEVVVVDKNTYAGDVERLREVRDRLMVIQMDVREEAFDKLMKAETPDVVVHFAAETHVSRGETDADHFYRSNIDGTRSVIEACVAHEPSLVVHISTDEVYGPFEGVPFEEDDKGPGRGHATSAYAQSKALAEDVARSYSSDIPLLVVRPTNCFGPWQHPEKAIARWCVRATSGEDMPVWGDGSQVRDWMYVDDACAGIERLIEAGEPGSVYNLGPEGAPVTNLEMARMIARRAGRSEGAVYRSLYDRPDHDQRYAVDASRIKALGWKPELSLEEALGETVTWYAEHRSWWSRFIEEAEQLYVDAVKRPDE